MKNILTVFLCMVTGYLGLAEVVSTTMDTSETSRSFDSVFLGYNGDFCWGGSWNDEALLAAFKSLHPGHLRYPAGTLANYWDWKTGWFVEGTTPPYGLDHVQPNPYTLADLKKACGSDVTPVFVLNIMTATLEDQLEMLHSAKEMGMPVQFVELGNEFYLESPDYEARFPSAQDYVLEANQWAEAIKNEFPGVKVCAVGAAVRDGDKERRTTWNDIVFPRLENMDAVAIHIYSGTGLPVRKNELFEATGLVKASGATAKKSGIWGDAAEQVAQLKKFREPGGVENMLAMPFLRLKEVHDLDALPIGLEVWVTEYNLFDRIGPVRGTWAHGLFSAAFTFGLLKDPRIKLATDHDLYGNPIFSAIYRDEDIFNGLVKTPLINPIPAPRPKDLSASGCVLQMIGKAMSEMSEARLLSFTVNPQVVTKDFGAYPSLSGWLFSNGSECRAMLMNCSASTFSISLEETASKFRQMTQYSSSPFTYVCGTNSLNICTAPVSNSISISPWSIVFLQ